MTTRADIKLSAATEAIRTRTFTEETSVLLRSVVAQGGAKSLIAALVAQGRNAGRDDYKAFTGLQQSLQDLADIDPMTGRVLMLYLAPLAGDLYFHDIWDRINILMWKDRPTEFGDRLREIISQEEDSKLKETFSRWL